MGILKSGLGRRGARVLVAISLALGLVSAATAAPSPEMEFTKMMAAQLHGASPKTKVHVGGPLHLVVSVGPGDVDDIYLARIYDGCERDQMACIEQINGYVTDAAAYYKGSRPELDAKSLRINIEPSAFVDALRKHSKDGTGPAARHVVGDYWAVVVWALPTTTKLVTVGDLDRLGLTPDKAFTQVKRSIGAASARRDLKAALAEEPHGIAVRARDPYQSGLFAFPELWADAASATPGGLLVGVPATDILSFGDAGEPRMAERIAEGARVIKPHVDHPLSDAVFRWSPDGWTEVVLAGRGAPPTTAPAKAGAIAQLQPMDFTNRVAAGLRQAAPAADVKIDEALHLTATSGPNNVHEVYLDRLYAICQHDPDGCSEEMRTYVHNAVAYYGNSPPPPDVKSLRITVRREDFVQSLRENLQDGTGPAARHVTGDYWAVIVVDQPTTIRMISVGELAKLGLTPDQAFAHVKRTMGLKMRRLLKAMDSQDPTGVSVFPGDEYQSALFAFPELWKGLADARGGQLDVIVPTTDVIAYTDGAPAGAAKMLAGVAKGIMTKADHPLSDAVFRWTPDGWTEVPPASKGD